MQAEHLLGLELVHGQRAREDAAARVRDAHQLEQALHAAVFAAPPVERQEDDVDVGGAQALVQARAVVAPDHPHDVVTPALEGRGDAVARAKRDLTLRAASPHQDSDAPSAHWDRSEVFPSANFNCRAGPLSRRLRAAGGPGGLCLDEHGAVATVHPFR